MVENEIKAIKQMRVKECMFPKCKSKDTIRSHALQNNGIISRLAVKGHVLMPYTQRDAIYLKNNKRFGKVLNEVGKNEATTFFGFCKKHDDSLFKPIETAKWKISTKTNFLFSYRTLCAQLRNKEEFLKRLKKRGKSAFEEQQAVYDLKRVKRSCDYYLEKNFLTNCPLQSVVWHLQSINFAYDGMYQPIHDFEGKIISTSKNLINYPILITVLPYQKHSIAIISWLKKDNKYFGNFISNLKHFNINEREVFLSNLALMSTDDLILSPRIKEKLESCNIRLFEGDLMEYKAVEEMVVNHSSKILLEDPGINLFTL